MELLRTSQTLHLGDKSVFQTMATTYGQIQEFCSLSKAFMLDFTIENSSIDKHEI